MTMSQVRPFYSSPSGEVHGEISLKRQYRIRKGKMEYMIESSVTVHDDILQKELCSNADDKMKNIVMTIQREQNRIIRNEDTPVLIIQGVAGSGKTSIALHRIAYLLYAQKGKISSKDILIISPNKVFADYISNVLPELGEDDCTGNQHGTNSLRPSSITNISIRISSDKFRNYWKSRLRILSNGYNTKLLSNLFPDWTNSSSIWKITISERLM